MDQTETLKTLVFLKFRMNRTIFNAFGFTIIGPTIKRLLNFSVVWKLNTIFIQILLAVVCCNNRIVFNVSGLIILGHTVQKQLKNVCLEN